jgi:2-oxoisovalerate dehydrogenase E1 component
MAVSRTAVVDSNFRAHVAARPIVPLRHDLDSPVVDGFRLTAREALRLFECQVESRITDLIARDLKNEGKGFYTIGSSGHEGNAAVAAAARPDDPAFLHYRSGGFFLSRAGQKPGESGAFDVLLGLASSSDEPIAGGRHKVFGSLSLQIPPQTSTIASHLPKAVGCAVAIDRRARLLGVPDDRIAICTFGDASANHSTSQGAFNAAGWAAHQQVPVPCLFVCEDNGIGISVRTPEGWTGAGLSSKPDVAYFHGDGLELHDAYEAACEAVDYVRSTRRPAILHLRTVRLMGHAGSDVEQTYRPPEEIAAAEARDPLLRTASILVDNGWIAPDDLMALYEDTWARLSALSREAVRRPRITSGAEVARPLFFHDDAAVAAGVQTAPEEARRGLFGGELPEQSDRPRHLAFQINRALHDVLLAHPEAILFGEDVARKGGVYHVSADLWKNFGNARVFNTLLDEQSILGLAIGAGHAGLLPIPEIQYLAYLINAIDQLRGEAASLQYFSQGQFANPMVLRMAGLAYQKGFGGHFHNDNGIAAVREIPGILLGCPAKGADAVRMLRTMVAAAKTQGRVCVFLEPIALYMTRDLHAAGDNAWQTVYPEPGDAMPVGEVGCEGDGTDLCIASYANGLWMSLRVAKRLEAEGVRCRVVDLRWLLPLPIDALLPHAEACGRLLVVDECRRSSGIADTVMSEVVERTDGRVRVRRVQAMDTYIPLGDAANLVLVSEADIEAGARKLLETS